MKKHRTTVFLSVFFTFCLALSFMSATVGAEQIFTDVNEDVWYYDAVNFCFNWNLMNGTGNDLFSPSSTLTRGMIVTILHRFCAEPDASGLGNPFTDIPGDAWYTDAVRWAAANNIVSGYGNGLFGPDDAVTKEQLAVLIHRIGTESGQMPPAIGAGVPFTDIAKVENWAYEAVFTLNILGLFMDIPSLNFGPQTPATRAEVACILHRYFIVAVDKDDEPYEEYDEFWYEEAVYYIISNLCEETINHLNTGMTALCTGDYEIINNEICWKVALGTDHEEYFAPEFIYAVGLDSYTVYSYDALTDTWLGLAMG